jgi:hypothetical protein
MSNYNKTPLLQIPRQTGGTLYVFPSAHEDIGLNLNYRVNSVALSHYALLNIPTTETNVEQTSETEVPAQQGVTEEQVLEFLNNRGLKYNGEVVRIDKFDDLVSTYQKGLNYDKVKAKADADKDNEDVLSYITSKAQSMGISAKDYIQKVKDFEKQQEQAKIEQHTQSLIERGIDEETARSVAETRAYMEQLKNEKAEFEKQKAELQAQKDKDREYEEFLKAYPEVKAEEIPVEVFENAKSIGMKSAYAQYENKLLKEKIKQMELNNKNASTSPVTAISDGSPTEQATKDAFLEGFDSV